MVKHWVAVLIIGIILSPVKPFVPEPKPENDFWIKHAALTEKIFVEDTTTTKTTTTTTTTTTTATPRPSPVLSNCVFYDKPDYDLPFLRLHIMEKTWFQAKETCEREGGHLASPRTAQELEFYMDYVSRLRQVEKWYWIGVSRQSVKEPWKTVQGDVLSDEKLLDGSWSLPGNPLAETGCWRILDGYVKYTNCSIVNFRSSFLCERETC